MQRPRRISTSKNEGEEMKELILYRIMYFIMLISFSYISFAGADVKMKIVAILFTLSNIILFWR